MTYIAETLLRVEVKAILLPPPPPQAVSRRLEASSAAKSINPVILTMRYIFEYLL
jgi:hypothetical protein